MGSQSGGFTVNPARLWVSFATVFALVLALLLPFYGFTAESNPAAAKNAATIVHCPELGGPKDMPEWLDFNLRFGINVRIVNETIFPVGITTKNIDCYDFSGDQNPSLMDGAVIAAKSTSPTYDLIARRVCPWIDGDIFGKFQEREAHWDTRVMVGSVAAFDLPSTMFCSSYRRDPTMCRAGVAQDRDTFLVRSGSRIFRVSLACAENVVTITLKTEI